MKQIQNSFLIQNVRLVDAEKRTQMPKDILITDGIIKKIENHIDEKSLSKQGNENTVVYNASGKYALPSFVDLHTHLRDPGLEYKEDIKSGTAAAAAGGYGCVVSMPNSKPSADHPDILRYIRDKAEKVGNCTVLPAAAITLGQAGAELCDYDALSAAGACAFTDDGNPISNAGVMREAMLQCAKKDYLMISHAEELALTGQGVINEGEVSRLLGVAGIPNSSEDTATARDILLAEETGCRLHIAHVSTRGSVALIREAKKRGVRVSAETCPHYFALCDDDVVFYGVNAKMKPPLRSRADVQAIIEGLADGTIDCISTDHAPHSAQDKGEHVSKGAFGILGLQTAFACAYTYLVLTGYMDLYRLTELMSLRPAEIIGAHQWYPGAGQPAVGKPAALSILNINTDYIFEKQMIVSKSYNSPFIGMNFVGKVDAVISSNTLHTFS